MTCQAFKPALNSMEVDAVGWDSDGLGYDTPGDDVDGDEHAEGAALEDLGPLRDKPAAAAAARARGQYGRAAALRKAIAPAANVHVAARRLRDLAGPPLRTAVQFGALGGRSGAAVQCLLVLQRHGHPAAPTVVSLSLGARRSRGRPAPFLARRRVKPARSAARRAHSLARRCRASRRPMRQRGGGRDCPLCPPRR